MIRESRIQWQGPSWDLRLYPVTRPDGTVLEKGFVDHPGAVVLVPLLGEEVVMLRQYRFSIEKPILELPAGTREREENWLVCAQRELREETGYRATSFISLGHVWPAPGYSNEVMAIYLATGLSRDPLKADFDEIIELQPHPLEELAEMAIDGRLRDGKSIVGILRAAHYLRHHSPSESESGL